jgi:hypothetical protein
MASPVNPTLITTPTIQKIFPEVISARSLPALVGALLQSARAVTRLPCSMVNQPHPCKEKLSARLLAGVRRAAIFPLLLHPPNKQEDGLDRGDLPIDNPLQPRGKLAGLCDVCLIFCPKHAL